MNYLKLYENFKEYYEFDAIEFYKNFKKVFNVEKEKSKDPNYHSKLYKLIDDYYNGLISNISPGRYENILDTKALDDIVEELVRNILQGKKVDFYVKNKDFTYTKYIGTVITTTTFYYSLFFKEFTYHIYKSNNPNGLKVDQSKPVNIYDKKTEIEKYIDRKITGEKYRL